MAVTKAQTSVKDDTSQDKQQTTTPGAGPADTTNINERVQSAQIDVAAASAAGLQSVNAVEPVADAVWPSAAAAAADTRTETIKVRGADGRLVSVTHNLGTGATTKA